MDYTPFVNSFLHTLLGYWYYFAIALVVLFARTPRVKGWIGEQAIRISARLFLDPKVYRPFHDLLLATPDGSTQIDHVFVSPYGLFIIEIKNMKGWISGSEKQRQWTQKIYRRSFRFQNPLHQNFRHARAMAELLGVPEASLHSIIVFVGGGTFKTPVPPNVVQGGAYIRYIKRFHERVFSDEEVTAICRQIDEEKLQSSRSARREHVRHVRVKKEGASTAPKCPRCGTYMVLREIRRGPKAGQEFWGCSGFPSCRAVQKAS